MARHAKSIARDVIADILKDPEMRAEILATLQIAPAMPVNAERKRAIDVLDDVMHAIAEQMKKYQPRPGNKDADEKKFAEWAEAVRRCAADLAPFQSPTFRAIAIKSSGAERDPNAVFAALLDQINADSRDKPLFITNGHGPVNGNGHGH